MGLACVSPDWTLSPLFYHMSFSPRSSEEIWEIHGDVLSLSRSLFGWGFCLALLRFYAHVCLVVRFYAQRATERRFRVTGEWREVRRRGPGTGWGSSLCCWSGCHITPCGDDCAIYCLASAGDWRRRSQTRSTAAYVNRIHWMKEKLSFSDTSCEIVWLYWFLNKVLTIFLSMICATWICVFSFQIVWFLTVFVCDPEDIT